MRCFKFYYQTVNIIKTIPGSSIIHTTTLSTTTTITTIKYLHKYIITGKMQQ